MYSDVHEGRPFFLLESASRVSAYFRIAATAAEAHIQKTAPAPPKNIAAETPTMFPTPRTPPSASHRAERGLIRSPLFASFRKNGAITAHGRIKGSHFIYIIKKTPAPSNAIGKTVPIIREFKKSSIKSPLYRRYARKLLAIPFSCAKNYVNNMLI